MSGMNGISNSGNMANCGMQGMHGNTAKKEVTKSEHSQEAHQNAKSIPDDIRGKSIDYKL